LRAWIVKKNFEVIEVEGDEVNIKNGNIFLNKEEAFTNAINSINERVSNNLTYLQRAYEEFKEQKDVVMYYLKKREKLVSEGIGVSNIDTNITFEELEEIDKEVAVALLGKLNNADEIQFSKAELKKARKLLKAFHRRHPGSVTITDVED